MIYERIRASDRDSQSHLRRTALCRLPAQSQFGVGGMARVFWRGRQRRRLAQCNPARRSNRAAYSIRRVPAGRIQPDPRAANLSERLYQLIHNHRVRGHIIAARGSAGRDRPQSAGTRTGFLRLLGKRTGSAGEFPDAALRNAADRPRNFPAAAQHLLPLHRRAVHAH